MTTPINMAVIGCGDIATTQHLPALCEHPDVQVVAVCDIDAAKAADAANRFGIDTSTTNYRDLLANGGLDAVVIATPPQYTPGLTIKALGSGLHVLCEKPMALTLDEAEAVQAAERASGKWVQVGFTYRHGALMDTMQRWVREGRLGSPLTLRISVFDEVWAPETNPEHYRRIFDTLRHGPPCIHDGAHSADHLHFFTGSKAVRVTAHGHKTRPEFPAPNYNSAVIEFSNGDVARLEIGWFYPQMPPCEFEILGPKGRAVFDRYRANVSLTAEDGDEVFEQDKNWVQSCFRAQLDVFLQTVRTGARPVPGTEEGIASLGLTKAMEEAMASGKASPSF